MSVLIKNNIIFLSRTQSKLIAILFLGTVKDNEKKLQTVKQSLIFQVLFSFISSNAQDIITVSGSAFIPL